MSLAKISTSTSFIYSGRSFMNIMNKTGPKTEPCGTPDSTDCVVDLRFFFFNYALLSARKVRANPID